MRAILVDDEYDTLEEMKGLLEDFAEIEIVGSYQNPLLVLPELGETQPDCAFVDIEMPGMSGLELADGLLARDPDIEVVFITAFNHYATEAFEVNVLDYVLKPVHPERFCKTVEKLCKKQGQAANTTGQEIAIRMLGGFEVLVGGKPVRWNRSKAKELFAYLLQYYGQRRNKYKICEELWPGLDPQKALINLQTAVYSLRKGLWAAGENSVQIDFSAESYELKIGSVFYDVAVFQKLCEQFQQTGDLALARKAAGLYLGEYADGEDWRWVQLTAEALSQSYAGLLRQIAQNEYTAGNWSEMITTAEKLLHILPFDGDIQRMLLDAAWRAEGMGGLARRARLLRRFCLKEYDMDMEPEAAAFCREKGLKLQV